jgi:hypothetical protein
MNTAFYLSRSFVGNDKTYTETDLLTASKYVVVLAEPGGGKTELMGSLARRMGTTTVTASKFLYVGVKATDTPLVIDAFDELSKVDDSGIYKLLGKAEATKATYVYLSSRSSEWDNAATKAFEDFFGPTLVVRLCEFKESEQQEIFENHVPGEDFAEFYSEVARFDLEMLLPNPQFLKLFADAYIESDRHFADKRSIFEKAVESLAREANSDVTNIKPKLSIPDKINLASEVFTKLLLSGAEGVCTSEATEKRMYPLLEELFDNDTSANAILATRLFKPDDSADQHRPVHKIVAEYCAANYLTKRIADPADTLTLSTCLPIIAPNRTVRDDLRGLLGWIAALGNKSIADSAIRLDPYAVLANGDPSQLESKSKRFLLNQLKEIEIQDPYFRRGDFWRRFSAAGFFTQDVIEEVRTLLYAGNDGQLRDLILELLAGSPAIGQLRDELRQLTLMPTESKNTRLLANRCLLDIKGDFHRSDLDTLISEASNTSLSIVAKTIETLGSGTFERDYLAEFLRVCSRLYPGHREQYDRAIGVTYFLKRFINGLDCVTTEWLLDEMTKDLVCICSKESYECDCRNGISKIVGSLLDRYFNLAVPPFDPPRVWKWVENLNFHEQKNIKQSKAVQILQENIELRQGIFTHVFARLNDREGIYKVRHKFEASHNTCHSGLRFREDDCEFIVDLAFRIDNLNLWSTFFVWQDAKCNKDQKGSNNLRRYMREQTHKKPLFIKEWAKINRNASQYFKQNKHIWIYNPTRKQKRHLKEQANIRTANIEYFQDNRELIERGGDQNCLLRFAELVLHSPDEIEHKCGDEQLVRNALRNCLDFITPHVPSLPELAKLRCESKHSTSVRILFAACLEIMCVRGTLEEVDLPLLRALRTDIQMGYSAISTEEYNALRKEVDRLIFADNDSAENFLRQYVEPQLAQPGYAHPEVLLLDEDVFTDLRPVLSMEWLRHFRELELGPLNTLFGIAARHGNRDDLKEIISERCAAFMSNCPNRTEDENIEQKRTFWLLRAWYFLSDVPETYWDWLKADNDTVLVLYEFSGRINHDAHFYWPNLTSSKVEAILDAFIEQWPKVNLPNHWGTGSPKEENAYRFLTDVIWSIDADTPNKAIPVLERLLADHRFTDLHKSLKSIHAGQVRKTALRDFEPPTPHEIVKLLDHDAVVTVEGLRQLVIQELQGYQNDIRGGIKCQGVSRVATDYCRV